MQTDRSFTSTKKRRTNLAISCSTTLNLPLELKRRRTFEKEEL